MRPIHGTCGLNVRDVQPCTFMQSEQRVCCSLSGKYNLLHVHNIHYSQVINQSRFGRRPKRHVFSGKAIFKQQNGK